MQKYTEKIFTPLFISIISVNLCTGVFSQCVMAGTPLNAQSIGQSHIYSSALVAIYIASIIISRTVSGALVDRFTRKRIIIIGSILMIGGSALPLIDGSLVFQVCSRSIQGLAFALIHTAASSAASDVLPKARFGEGIGYAALGPALGMALGPTLALWLTGFEQAEIFPLGLTCIGVAPLLLGIFMNYEKDPQKLDPTAGYRIAWEQRQNGNGRNLGAAIAKEPLKNRLFEKAALKGAIPMLFQALGMAVFFTFIASYAREAGYANPSYFFLISAVTAVSLRLFLAKLFDKGSGLTLFAAATIGAIATLLGILLLDNEVLFYILGIGYGMSFGLSVPVLNTAAIKASPPERFGPANALFFLAYDVGLGAGALLWGFSLEFLSYSVVFIGAIICFALAFAVSIWSFK